MHTPRASLRVQQTKALHYELLNRHSVFMHQSAIIILAGQRRFRLPHTPCSMRLEKLAAEGADKICTKGYFYSKSVTATNETQKSLSRRVACVTLTYSFALLFTLFGNEKREFYFYRRGITVPTCPIKIQDVRVAVCPKPMGRKG